MNIGNSGHGSASAVAKGAPVPVKRVRPPIACCRTGSGWYIETHLSLSSSGGESSQHGAQSQATTHQGKTPEKALLSRQRPPAQRVHVGSEPDGECCADGGEL